MQQSQLGNNIRFRIDSAHNVPVDPRESAEGAQLGNNICSASGSCFLLNVFISSPPLIIIIISNSIVCGKDIKAALVAVLVVVAAAVVAAAASPAATTATALEKLPGEVGSHGQRACRRPPPPNQLHYRNNQHNAAVSRPRWSPGRPRCSTLSKTPGRRTSRATLTTRSCSTTAC